MGIRSNFATRTIAMDFVDLHTHSTASDGTDSPAELVVNAAALGLRAVALTDHDTLTGLEAAEAAGRDCGITVIRGCEVSAASPYGEVHILGLWIPHTAQALHNVLENQRTERATRNHHILKKLADHGLALNYDDVLAVAGGETIGRPHIAKALVNCGYTASMREGFEKWLGSKGRAFVPRKTLVLHEAVRLLASLGATVSIAHPRLIPCPDSWLNDTIRTLIPHGLTALEAYHSEHSEADQSYCVRLARTLSLHLTGGSDYHGMAKQGITLGKGRGGLRVPYSILEALYVHRRAQGLPI